MYDDKSYANAWINHINPSPYYTMRIWSCVESEKAMAFALVTLQVLFCFTDMMIKS